MSIPFAPLKAQLARSHSLMERAGKLPGEALPDMEAFLGIHRALAEMEDHTRNLMDDAEILRSTGHADLLDDEEQWVIMREVTERVLALNDLFEQWIETWENHQR